MMSSKLRLIAGAVGALIAAQALGQDGLVLSGSRGQQKTLAIARTNTPPELDGVLDDPVWSEAAWFDDLHQYDPIDHGVPSERTVVYVTYDEDNLYVAARMWDAEPSEIRARQMVMGANMRFDDSFGIYLDPFNNKRTGYNFQVNPNSSRTDAVFETPTDLNRDWEGIWDAEARITDDGWIAEMVIPFKTLNFDPSNPNWGFTVERTIARKQEEIAWVSFNRQLNPAAAGLITGLTGVRQGVGLDVVPSLVTTQSKDFETGATVSETDPSLDVFYNFTPSLTGVLTLNTDFSATEVDDRQINLSRFSLFFPEKRDFFLQDVDIFSFGGLERNGIPFFSRRIGLGDNGEPVDLDVGAKLTGRVGRWSVGVLDVKEEAHQGIDSKNLFVGRISANVLRESSIGMILTDGDPNSNMDNSLAGLDFRYRNSQLPSGRVIESQAWYQQSDTQDLVGNDAAYGLRVATPNSTGWQGQFAYDQIQDNFNPALGFVNRSGIERTEFGAGYTRWPEHRWIRSIESGVNFENFDRLASGELETRSLFADLEIETNGGDSFGVQYNRDREVLFEPNEIWDGVIIPAGDYEFAQVGFEISGASQRIVAPSFEVSRGDFFGGDIISMEAEVSWRPNRHLFLSMAYEYNDVKLPGGDFTARLIQIDANIAFNVRWSWVNLIQYDNDSGSAGINSRLRWNPRAGQDFFFVVNHGFDATGVFQGLRSAESQVSVKYTHTFRF